MKTAAFVGIRISALSLAMLVGSAAWASSTTQAAPTGGASNAHPASTDSGCGLANMPRVTLFNAVMQPPQPGCAPVADPRIDNARAPQGVHRARSGQPLFRPDDNVRYSF